MLCGRVHFLFVEPFVMRHRRVVRISMNGKQKKKTECRQYAVERFHGSLRYGLSLASQDAPSDVSGTSATSQGWLVTDIGQLGARTTDSCQPDVGLSAGANRSENVAALASLAATRDAEIRP